MALIVIAAIVAGLVLLDLLIALYGFDSRNMRTEALRADWKRKG
jgi:hypothetical protein